MQSPPAAELQNNEIREGIITRKTWKQQHIYRLTRSQVVSPYRPLTPLSALLLLLLQDHPERDEGVPTRRPHRPLQDDQTREGQTQRAQPAEVPQLRGLPQASLIFAPKFVIFVCANYSIHAAIQPIYYPQPQPPSTVKYQRNFMFSLAQFIRHPHDFEYPGVRG